MIFFRVDGTHSTGMGHVFRCLNLARHLSSFSEILFFCEKSQKTKELIVANGFLVADPQKLEDFIEENSGKHIIITDLIKVKPTNSWCEKIQNLNYSTLTHFGLHDLGLNQFDCDIHIDGSIGNINPYIIRKESKYYLGKEFMTLDPLFTELNKKQKAYKDYIVQVLVSFGGSDPSNIADTVIPYLSRKFSRLNFTIIAGPEKKILPTELEKLENVVILKVLNSISDIMFDSDLMITAGGIMLYESACVGTPSIAICHDEFQLETASRFDDKKASINLGLFSNLDLDFMTKLIHDLSEDKVRRQTMGENGRELIDGKGLQRVSKIITNILSL
jgi:UDP-2,4-diacetamido-2,4,6-trideoxy-beta-L-altropyranose hydrolase